MAKPLLSDEVMREIEATRAPIPSDQLLQLRKLVAKTRDLEHRKAELEEQLKEVNRQLSGEGGLYFHKLPTLMDAIGVSVLKIEAEGNMPPVEVKCGPYYAANIAAGWPPEKRQAAFKWLDENGHGDLIKTEVAVTFPREARPAALKFAKQTKAAGWQPEVKEAVHHGTLTAWLREQVEDHGYVPPLDILGGTVARSVKLKVKP